MQEAQDGSRARRGRLAETLVTDIRFALRTLRRSPGFTAVAVLMLAVGVGASTAVFSLVDAVLLKPLPYPHAERLVFPWRLVSPALQLGFDKAPWGRVDFQIFARETRAFSAAGAFVGDSFNLTGAGDPVRLDGVRASAGFFQSLGVVAALGRTFTAEDDRPGEELKVVLGDDVWRSHFGADPRMVGRTVRLNGASYTVIGVMPRGFAFPRGNEMPDSFGFAPRARLWVPLALDPGPFVPTEPDALAVVARLRPGVTLAQAQADMDLVDQSLARQLPPKKGPFISQVIPVALQIGAGHRRPLLLLLAAVGVVLLIACSNVGSLVLTRALRREREIALRASLGASRARLVRQLLTESLVLAGTGGLGGVLLAKAGIWGTKTLAPPTIPRIAEAGLDAPVLVFALVVTFLTGILFGLAPALGATRKTLAAPLQESGRRATAGAAAHRTRNALLVSQVALAFVLVVAAGLLVRTFARLLDVDPGFQAARALIFEMTLPAATYRDQGRIVAFYDEARRRLANLPGVRSAGIIGVVPLGGPTQWTTIRIPGRVTAPGSPLLAQYTVASPGYFSAAATPILRGRPFLESDTAQSQPVTVISSSMARAFWPGQDPIGKQVGPAGRKYPLATVVGVAADVKRLSLRESPLPEMYEPYCQNVWPSLLTMDAVVRTSLDPVAATASARAAIRAVDPEVPLANVRSLAGVTADRLTQPRFAMLLLAAFGGLALLLAMVGLYGVTSFSVAQRTQEIGIRIALGAQRGTVSAMIFGQGFRLAAAGIGIGLAAAWSVTRLMSRFLYGVGAADPATFAVVALLITATAVAACHLPARRAMRVDPAVALRDE